MRTASPIRSSAVAAPLVVLALIVPVAVVGASNAMAEDNQAGTPLVAGDAAGPWTVQTGGRDICVVTLGADRSVKASAACAAAIPMTPTRWETTANGMRLVDRSGGGLIAFDRWSNSLLVSHRSSGVDVQLRRGTGPWG